MQVRVMVRPADGRVYRWDVAAEVLSPDPALHVRQVATAWGVGEDAVATQDLRMSEAELAAFRASLAAGTVTLPGEKTARGVLEAPAPEPTPAPRNVIADLAAAIRTLPDAEISGAAVKDALLPVLEGTV